MQYAPKTQEFRQKQSSYKKAVVGSKPTNSKNSRTRHVTYKPILSNENFAQYQPKQNGEKESTCSSSQKSSSPVS